MEFLPDQSLLCLPCISDQTFTPFDCFSIRDDSSLDVHDSVYTSPRICNLMLKRGNEKQTIAGLYDALLLCQCLEDSCQPFHQHVFNSCRMKVSCSHQKAEGKLFARKNLCKTLVELRSQFDRMCLFDKSVCDVNSVLPFYADWVTSIENGLTPLENFKDFVSLGNRNAPASFFHQFHMNLDLRWYILTVKYQIFDYIQKHGHTLVSSCIEPKFRYEAYKADMLDTYFMAFLCELVQLSIYLFEKTRFCDLPEISPFPCKCLREIWLMLHLFWDNTNTTISMKSFEDLIMIILERIMSNNMKQLFISSQNKEVFLPITCTASNPVGFSLWFFCNVTLLDGYTSSGEFLGTSSPRFVSNYPHLNVIFTKCLSTDVSTEEQLRVYLQLLKPILTHWYELNSLPFMKLWDYFQSRLNSFFLVPTESLEALALMRSTGAGLFEQVKNEDWSNTNSFSLFLKMLGKFIERCFTSGNVKPWQHVKGRIFIKFTPQKMEDLSELGLYHFACLFLMLADRAELKEMAEKLQEYLGMLHLEKLSLARQNVVWKAHLALILLHISKGKDIKEVAQPLVSLVHCHTNDTALMKLFVKDVQHIFELNPTLELSRHVLFENWLLQYLSHTAENSIYQFGQITSFLLALLQHHNFKLTNTVIAENLISFLKNFCADSKSAKCAQVINLAGELTAWSLNQPDHIRSSFIDLFRYFGTSLVVDVKDSQLYLVVLLQKQHALDALIKLIPNCVHLIIKAWIRIILSTTHPNSTLPLTKMVENLLEQLTNSSNLSLVKAEDPLYIFGRILTDIYAKLETDQEKISSREKCCFYFDQVIKIIDPLLKKPEVHGYEVLDRVYLRVLKIIQSVGPLLYLKNKSNSVLPPLISNLLLPSTLANVKLHPFRIKVMKKYLHLYMIEIEKLYSPSDAFIIRTLKSLVARHLNLYEEEDFTQHTLLKCFKRKGQIGRFIVETIQNDFLQYKSSTEKNHKSVQNGLRFLTVLIRQCNDDEVVLQLVMELCLSHILKEAIREVTRVQQHLAFGLLNELLKSPLIDQNKQIRETFLITLVRLYSHMAFSSQPLFQLLTKLARNYPKLIACTLPDLQREIKTVELSRGVAFDHSLRTAMSLIEAIVSQE